MSERATILVVDDTSESLALLVNILIREGYSVMPANSGELALASIAQKSPDLILLDVRMKGISGLDVCKAVKADSRTQNIPIILVSASVNVAE